MGKLEESVLLWFHGVPEAGGCASLSCLLLNEQITAGVTVLCSLSAEEIAGGKALK